MNWGIFGAHAKANNFKKNLFFLSSKSAFFLKGRDELVSPKAISTYYEKKYNKKQKPKIKLNDGSVESDEEGRGKD